MKKSNGILAGVAVAASLALGSVWIGNGVRDTNGNLVTDDTAWGDIDTAVTKVGDVKSLIAPDYENVSNKAMSAVQPEDVTNTVRTVVHSTNRYMWDPATEVCYYADFYNDYLTYVAITNIDVTLPENAAALEACDEIVSGLHQ